MALSRAKYRRLPELYVEGTEVVLKDGSVMWVQVLNPFQTEEARHDAQVSRSRLVMALNKHGSEEMAFVEAALLTDGLEGARERLVEEKVSDSVVKIVQTVRSDPDWVERVDLMDRSDDAEGLEDVEKTLLSEIQRDYLNAIQKALDDERAYQTHHFKDMKQDELLEEYKKLYTDRRGNDLATAEFRVVEIWYGARACEGVKGDDGTWNHDACEGHSLQVFESKAEVRQLPSDLTQLLGQAYDALAMSVRDAKDLARPASSSDSSRRPKEEAESTPSTPVETPSEPLGTSSQPSLTLSPS